MELYGNSTMRCHTIISRIRSTPRCWYLPSGKGLFPVALCELHGSEDALVWVHLHSVAEGVVSTCGPATSKQRYIYSSYGKQLLAKKAARGWLFHCVYADSIDFAASLFAHAYTCCVL